MKNSIETVKIMDISFINTTKKDLLHYHLFPKLNTGQQCFVVTANPEIVMKAREDDTYKQIIQSADYVIPDGSGIIMAANYIKQPLQEKIPGYDLMIDLLKFAEIQGLSCYFLGAKEYINEKAVLQAEKQFPNLKIAGYHHGFFEIDDSVIADEVANSNPDIVLVALGFPKQEQWIAKHKDKFSKGLFMGVGGSFDVLAGEVKRAPKQWINLNLEWLYRLLKQPFRYKRIIKVFEFMFRVILKK
ncbi:WecB/TagA/CpsF family glycosyltransferase [Oceanobacillus massiliensis]|uniref:WecB/TagA/CpsF family glycosyltransferase n=1 Tax=Oceanobacillus massiliensis TaxID=1465765 RepID=UPI00028876D0|nr:WecB/TagA/CpsF family glycosyltransferase [Oceanobacillus massiliensis]